MKKISPEQTYYYARVVREGWLGSRSSFMCRRLLSENSAILKPVYVGAGRSTRIMISGTNILEYRKVNQQQ